MRLKTEVKKRKKHIVNYCSIQKGNLDLNAVFFAFFVMEWLAIEKKRKFISKMENLCPYYK